MDQIGINNLYALKLGNEPTFYPWFSITEYAFDTTSYAAGDLATQPAFQDGLNANTSSIEQIAYHYYQNQHSVANFTALQDYIRHAATKSNITNFLPDIKYLRESLCHRVRLYRDGLYHFIGKSGKTRVVELDIGTPQNRLYGGYAAYDDGKLARVAPLNLKLWDSRRSSGDHSEATLSLSGLEGSGRNITVLNADNGALAQKNLTHSGLEWTWAPCGKQKKIKDDSKVRGINGTEVNITVNATQAVLLEIQ
ncbi:hypothetical protein F5Y12DRAFT_721317 [Xylaria sp. FL1777]|nr:hypothetical protein F5Y12DRAFT_721317 [Xylaria sp. FL1777]